MTMDSIINAYATEMNKRNCIYILRLPKISVGDCTWDNVYKFGITGDIGSRLRTHYRNLQFTDVVLIKDYKTYRDAAAMENTIKSMAELVGERVSIMGNTELIQTADIAKYINTVYKIDEVCKEISSIAYGTSIEKITFEMPSARDWYQYQLEMEKVHAVEYEKLLESMGISDNVASDDDFDPDYTPDEIVINEKGI